MKRIPDLRSQPKKRASGGTSPDLPLGGLVILMLALIALVGVAPGLSHDPGPDGYWQRRQDQGYPAIVQRLVNEGLLDLRTLPRRAGEPPRRIIEIDEAAVLALAAEGAMGRCGEDAASLAQRVAQCRRVLKKFDKTATRLGNDRARADPMIWRMSGDRLLGLRADAHRLLESGYRRQRWGYGVSYAGGGWPPSASWVLVESGTGRLRPLTWNGRGPCTSDITALPPMTCFDEMVMVAGKDAGRLTRSGRGADAARPLALRSGDVIGIAEAPNAQRYQLLHRPQALSMVAPDGRRVREPRLAVLLEEVDADLSKQLRGTIRPDLQARAQAVLERALVASTAAQPRRSLRGALLLMDGMTGEIAAAASYPAREAHLSAQDRAQFAHLDWIRQNQNFELLLVGSAAKVPFAAAILRSDPALAAMITRNGARCLRWTEFMRTGAAEPLGPDCPPGGAYRDHGPARVDLETFIRTSNNFYAFSLLRRAWLGDSAPDSRWQAALAELACTREGRGTGCPVYPWRAARATADTRALPGLRLSFDPAEARGAPAAALLYSITGLGEFHWTTVQLAQAYARLISARAVSPRLTAAPAGDATDIAAIDPGPHWKRIFAGMRGVIAASDGTAYKQWTLGDLAPGVTLVGKTGTPTVNPGLADPDGKVFVLAAIRTMTGAAPARPGDICGLRIAVVNIQYHSPSGVRILDDLIGPPAVPGRPMSPVRRWMTAPCREQAA